MFQSSSASLGSLALYRSSIQSVVYTVGNLVNTARMAFQGIFFMGAFCAAMNIEPRLTPPSEDTELYPSITNGMKIEARYLKQSGHSNVFTFYLRNRHLSYTYPGSKEPSLKDVTFNLEAGESLAIVGYNGSGKFRQKLHSCSCTHQKMSREIHSCQGAAANYRFRPR